MDYSTPYPNATVLAPDWNFQSTITTSSMSSSSGIRMPNPMMPIGRPTAASFNFSCGSDFNFSVPAMPWDLQHPKMQRFPPGGPSPYSIAFQNMYLSNGHYVNMPSPLLATKRKQIEHMDGPLKKQFISEEKMIEHMWGLHIGPDYTTHGEHKESSVPCTEFKVADLPEGARLVLSETLRKLKDEDILPRSLLKKSNFDRSASMALVLWKPPNGHLNNLPYVKLDKDDDTEDVSKDKKEDTDIRNQTAAQPQLMDIEMQDNNNYSMVNLNTIGSREILRPRRILPLEQMEDYSMML